MEVQEEAAYDIKGYELNKKGPSLEPKSDKKKNYTGPHLHFSLFFKKNE